MERADTPAGPGLGSRSCSHVLDGSATKPPVMPPRVRPPLREQMLDFDQLNDVIGTAALLEEGKRYG